MALILGNVAFEIVHSLSEFPRALILLRLRNCTICPQIDSMPHFNNVNMTPPLAMFCNKRPMILKIKTFLDEPTLG